MACDAQTLETLSGIDGLARLSQRGLMLALAGVYGSALTAAQAIVLAAANKYAALSDRHLDAVLLAILCVGGGGCVIPTAPVLAWKSNNLFASTTFTWTEAADPSLDFFLQVGTTLGGPYPNQFSFASSLRTGTAQPVYGFPLTRYAVIQARNSITCVSSNSNEINF